MDSPTKTLVSLVRAVVWAGRLHMDITRPDKVKIHIGCPYELIRDPLISYVPQAAVSSYLAAKCRSCILCFNTVPFLLHTSDTETYLKKRTHHSFNQLP